MGTTIRTAVTVILALAVGGRAELTDEQECVLEALVRQAFCRAGGDPESVCYLTVQGKAPSAALLKRLADLPVRALPTPPPESELVFAMDAVHWDGPERAKVYAEIRGVPGPLLLGCTYHLRRVARAWVVQKEEAECVIT